MTSSSDKGNASSSSSVPPPLQQFTLEELIRVLQNHRIDVISPHQQMQNGERYSRIVAFFRSWYLTEINEQRQVESDVQEQLAIERSLAEVPASNRPPAVVSPPASEIHDRTGIDVVPSTSPAPPSSTEATEGSWTLFHTQNIPTAILTGGSSQLTSPIPTDFIDLIIAGLVQARIDNGVFAGNTIFRFYLLFVEQEMALGISTSIPKGRRRKNRTTTTRTTSSLLLPAPTSPGLCARSARPTTWFAPRVTRGMP